MPEEEKNLLDFADIVKAEVEVGETYPMFGALTDLVEEEDGRIVATLNSNIKLHMVIGEEKIETLKNRMYETGIFFAEVISKDDNEVIANCRGVVFGKSQTEGSH